MQLLRWYIITTMNTFTSYLFLCLTLLLLIGGGWLFYITQRVDQINAANGEDGGVMAAEAVTPTEIPAAETMDVSVVKADGLYEVTLSSEGITQTQKLHELLVDTIDTQSEDVFKITFFREGGVPFTRADYLSVFGLTFPSSGGDDLFGDDLSLHVWYDEQRQEYFFGASVDYAEAADVIDFLASKELYLVDHLGALLPDDLDHGKAPIFADGAHNVHKIRYYNIDDVRGYSLDYAITDQYVVFSTSQAAMQRLLDASFSEPYVAEEILERKSVLSFGIKRVDPEVILDGPGTNIDSPEFWVNPVTGLMSLFVSDKKHDLIEIWSAPFAPSKVQTHDLTFEPNGLAIDALSKTLIVADAENKKVVKLSLPSLARIGSIGSKDLDEGENNVAALRQGNQVIVFASEDETVYGFDMNTGERLYKIKPPVEEIEEVLIDPYYKVVYVPDEQGGESDKNPGGLIKAFHLDGRPYARSGVVSFGAGKFSGDGEGVALYPCMEDGRDTGKGFMVFTNQVFGPGNSFEFFDRRTWRHLGSLVVNGVIGTDGIGSYETPTKQYPDGVLSMTNNDASTAIVSWTDIFEVTGLSCNR